jgi:hypothetical protein
VWLVLGFWKSALWPTSHPALELGFHCVGLLGACFFASPPFSGEGQWSFSQPHAVSVLWWFADCFTILQHCLTLDVTYWLRRLALWTTTWRISGSSYHPPTVNPSALTVFVTECLCTDQLPALPPFSGVLKAPTLSAVCSFSVPCLLFSFFVCGGQGSVCPGAMLVYSKGGWGNTTWCLVLTYWSAECLLSRFGASVWWHGSPPVFSV